MQQQQAGSVPSFPEMDPSISEVKVLRLHRVGMFLHDVLRDLLAGITRSLKGDQNILWLVTSYSTASRVLPPAS
jgi:hypothetical protein